MTLAEMKQRRAGDDVQPPPGRRMSEDEFVAWIGEKTRAEWVDGKVIMMSPVSGEHDRLGWWLRSLIQHFVDSGGLGEVRGSEFMVRLGKRRQRRMPDISFVRKERAEIVGVNHIEGTPDLVIEIVSPDSVARDWREKYVDYEKAGVKEYWVVDSLSQRLEAYALVGGKKYRKIEPKEEKIASVVLRGLYVKASWLFGKRQVSVFSALKELGISA